MVQLRQLSQCPPRWWAGVTGLGNGLFERPGGTKLSALERLEQEDRATEVRRCVARLEPNRRLTLLLREVEELTYEEIAEMTGVPVGTVRSRLARAREDLRGMLGGRT